MLCKIADLLAEVPEAGGLAPRCEGYRYNGTGVPDITIREEAYRYHIYHGLDADNIAYLESCFQFYMQLLKFGGFYLHAAAVELDGRAYLFSGPSGMGKSTHTRLWKQLFGDKVCLFNDDKPALRLIDGTWYAYGTPWCGKDGINENRKVPLAGICFLKQAPENQIRCLNGQEAFARIFSQTIHRHGQIQNMDLLLDHLDKLIGMIPVFELENRPEPDAARLSYETMYSRAKELGL